MIPKLSPKRCITALIGSAILSFGLYNVHSMSGVTEGGVLGLTLLLHHWFGISPSVSGFIMNLLCYLLGFRVGIYCVLGGCRRKLFDILRYI